jgi:hypothetical protein
MCEAYNDFYEYVFGHNPNPSKELKYILPSRV